MFTSYDKFFAALIMAALFGLKQWFGIELPVGDALITQLSMFLASLVVLVTPNKTVAK